MRLAACILLLAMAAGARGREPASTLQIAAAESYSRKCGGQALVVLQTGRTLHESYDNGGAALPRLEHHEEPRRARRPRRACPRPALAR